MTIHNFLKNNKEYFNQNFSSNSDEIVLFESFYPEKNLIYGMTKVGLTLSSILKCKPICILPPSNKNHDFIKSLCKNTINSRSKIIKSILNNFIFLFITFFTINKKKLLSLTIDGNNIGKHIYDAILIRNKIVTIKKVSFNFRLNIVIEIAFYFFFRKIFLNYKIKYLVLGDNTYRHGLLFMLAKEFNINCISPVSLNSFKLSKHTCINDYNEHCYSITSEFLLKIKNKKEAISISNNYFQKRYSGLINQHDVLNAFKGKKLKNKQNFITDYNLDPNKKIVAIMPHIFCDAPHAYPDTLYSDYYEWFINTAKILLENTYINVIVKEHPSANLYNEQGKLEEILRDHNLNLFLINSNENTHSVLQIADVVVTCGGTVGLEFSCAGNPVILAAKPPYSNLGFTYDNSTIQEYTNKLLTCHLLPRLTEIQTDNALLTAFLSYCNNDVDFTRLEIGSETISLGNQYSEDKLYSDIMTFQKTNIENQYIFNYLKSFLNNPNRLGLKL